MSLDWLSWGIPYGWLAVPLAITVISAVAQVIAKLRARKVLNQLRADLEAARLRHRSLLTEYHLRQSFLCRQLDLDPPEKPAALLPPADETGETTGQPRWRRVLRLKPKTTLTQGSTGSAGGIVGRHSFSVGSSLVWRTTGSNVIRVAQPVGSRFVSFAPRLVAFGGGGAASAGGSVAAATAVRAIIGAVSVVGWVIGPALAAWTVTSEIRKARRARRELRLLLRQQETELAAARAKNRRLEALYAQTCELPVEEKELLAAAR